MTNKIQEGDVLTLTAPYDRTSGEAALVGTIFGVAVTTVLSGANASFETEGVYSLAKAGVTITQGEAAYWDAATKLVTDVSAGNTLIGKFTEAAAIGASTARVKIG